jgi:epoxyqueuosine reductase
MKEAIRQHARALGFDDCRFTTAQPPDSAPQFQEWLAQRRHGEMAYLERTAGKRVDPQQVLPGARSIITLAVSYTREDRGAEPAGDSGPPSTDHAPRTTQYGSHGPHHSGLVARYARYGDYHQILGRQLEQLTAFVNRFGSSDERSLWYVDTGPVLERDVAQRAGVGFIGKHTNLISRQLGNWLFLAQIITTLDLEPDKPEKNRCGSCTRCIAACPTAAITGPFQLDARRCISYLTIELRGPIPAELRPAIGNRIFGCDDCLAVCPWNRFAQQGQMMKAHARPDLATPELVALLSLDEPAFKSRFAGTPMLRARRRGLLRNVCVALGNIGDETSLPALQKAAADTDPLIAEHATWAVRQIQSRRVASTDSNPSISWR